MTFERSRNPRRILRYLGAGLIAGTVTGLGYLFWLMTPQLADVTPAAELQECRKSFEELWRQVTGKPESQATFAVLIAEYLATGDCPCPSAEPSETLCIGTSWYSKADMRDNERIVIACEPRLRHKLKQGADGTWSGQALVLLSDGDAVVWLGSASDYQTTLHNWIREREYAKVELFFSLDARGEL
jgi:hypothetical protein